MTLSNGVRTGAPQWSSASDPVNRATYNTFFANLEANAALFASVTQAALPAAAAANAGTFYWCTDTHSRYYSDGTNLWDFTGSRTLYGTGTDGASTITGTVVLTKDTQYSSLTINAGATLVPLGYRIYCRTPIVCNGTIDCSGAAGSGNTGGIGGGYLAVGSVGTAGTLGYGSSGVDGGITTSTGPGGGTTVVADPRIFGGINFGGNGGNGGSGGGGTQSGTLRTSPTLLSLYGQTVDPSLLAVPAFAQAGVVAVPGMYASWATSGSISLLSSAGANATSVIQIPMSARVDGGIGGNGGTASSTSNAAGGGGAGGVVWIAAPAIYGTGNINAKGGAGAAGTGTNTGGGGGGGGGVIILVGAVTSGVNLSVVGGAAGAGSGGSGVAGVAGAAGRIVQLLGLG